MHATHARNADECVAKDGEWLEFYDYLDIVENAMNEAQCLGGKGARAAKRAGRSENDLVWGYPRLVYIYVCKLSYKMTSDKLVEKDIKFQRKNALVSI